MDDKLGYELISYIEGLTKSEADLSDSKVQYKLRKMIAAHIYREIQKGHYSIYLIEQNGFLVDCKLEEFMSRLITYKFTRYELDKLLVINCKQIYLGYGENEYIVLTLV